MNASKSQAWWLVLLITFMIGAAGMNAGAAEKATSEWVHPDPSGKLVYKTTPAGDRIMDFSTAG